MKILFICLGNICRSPTAHAFAEKYLPQHEFESAGTQAQTHDDDMDPRMQDELEKRGISFSHKPIQFTKDMLDTYDKIICMDQSNKDTILMQATKEQAKKVTKLLDGDVPDPWYNGGFDTVCDLIENGIKKLKKDLSS